MNKIKHSMKAKLVAQTGLMAVLVVSGCASPQPASAIGAGDADLMMDSFNKTFLVDSSYYKQSIDDKKPINTWQSSLDILVAEDAYERTGNATDKELVDRLCASWLKRTPPPWTWDGWNDDIGWFAMALIRGHQMTGNAEFLTQARYGFDTAWARGWDTEYNGGGIWEQQPKMTPPGERIDKEPISNNTLGVVACLIYQSNHDKWYLDRATQIYAWVRQNLYDPNTGLVYAGIERDGKTNKSAAVYSQGLFADYANYLYQITGDINYYNDAKQSIDYVKTNMTTGGVITDTQQGRDTWADTLARGLGHFVRDNHQWDAYYPWMVQNADAIMSSRRTDTNITYNGWNQATPSDNTLKSTQFASAVAWLQFTPATKPGSIAGMHTVISKQNNAAVDVGSNFTNKDGIVLSAPNNGQGQKWNFTQNADGSWNIISQFSWKALDCPGGAATSDLQIIQWQPSRDPNQRWLVEAQPDGSYKISNQASGLSLGSSINGPQLLQSPWNGKPRQRWNLK